MTTPPPPTIPELIESLGPPRNYAEQALLHDLARLERKSAEIAGALTTDPAVLPLTPWQRETLERDADRVWYEAHAIANAIQCYRAHGSTPVLEGVKFAR